jgi:hypothetical protein
MSCSKLISSLDKAESISKNIQCGENGHSELGWSKNIRERIVQFYFQLVRTSELESLDITYTNLIIDVLKEDITKEERDEYLSVLYKMIAHTRDIVNGKGEYTLAYMMIACWAKLQYVIKKSTLLIPYEMLINNPENELTGSELNIIYMFSNDFYVRTNQLAYMALENFLSNHNVDTEKNEHPIGSFKDVKYFIDYWRSLWDNQHQETKYMNYGLINLIIDYTNSQLRTDINTMMSSGDVKLTTISLVSKWIPREKSKFGWMTKYFARNYFSDQNWFSTAKTIEQQIRAEKKALTAYRKLLSNANAYIDTTQIKQCKGEWSNINFEKNVTSITLSKQKQAFMNVKKSNRSRYPENEDRVECANKFKEYIEKCKNGTSKIKGKRVSIYDFVKDACQVSIKQWRCLNLNIDDESVKTTIDTINLQWKDNSTINRSFNNLIAMVDTSGSMTSDNNIPLYNAIGLGIRIAERSTLGKRILTFDAKPTWLNLNDCPDFVSSVVKVQEAPWGVNTNFYLALEKILEAYVKMDLHPDDVEKYGLVIFSDMQIDACVCDYKSKGNTMFEEIERKFSLVGMNSRFKQPYKAPFIVFWNLRKTNGFPTSAMTKNVAMVSGYSPYLLNQFLDRGIEAFTEYNPWDIMGKTLEHHRYQKYETIMKQSFCSEIH